MLAALAALLAGADRVAACDLTTTGVSSVKAGELFTLNLSATDTGDGLPTSWTINWGDGAVETFAGNPASVTHTYSGVEPSRFSYPILASAVCGGRTYFQNDLAVASAATDEVNWYAHDAATNVAVTRAPVQSGPDAGLNQPVGAIIGPDGNLYVSGWSSGNIVRYDPSTGAFIDEFANGASLTPARTAMLGMAFGPDGHLYVAIPSSGEVLRFEGNSGAFIDAFVTAGLGGITEPEGLTFGPDGHLYVSDYTNNAVYRYDGTTGGFIDIFVAAGSGGLRDPEDLVFGPDGNLYVASDRDHEVLRYNGTTGAFINEFVATGSGGLENAQGVVFGPDGHLYVSSWKDHNVLRFNGTTGAFIGAYVSAGLGGLNTAAHFNFIPEHTVTVVNLFTYFKTVTVQRSRIPGSCGTTLTDYPMLFSVTDPDLAHTTSGGDVTDLEGDDIVFKAYDDATCGGAGLAPCTLDHEIERYVSTTGELVAWVRIPSVNTASAGSDTVITIHYGNSSITTSTENPAGVWDANHVAVWHLKESGNGTVDEFFDSTMNANHGRGGAGTGTQVPAQIATGQIGNGQRFDNTNDKIQVPNSASLGITGDISVSTWIKRNVVDWAAFLTKTDLSSTYDYQFLVSVSDTLGLWADGASPVVINTSVTFTDTTEWHHLAVSKSGNNVTFYIDGAVAAGGGVQTGGINNNPDPVVIGYDNEAGSAIGGDMDELRLSNAARSSCWIGAEYDNGNDPGDIGAPGFYIIGDATATAVELLSFEAAPLDAAVELSWETGSELDNLGFHVYRSSSRSGPYERVTASVIPGLGTSPAGARYLYVDEGLTNGETYFYELEDVETTGVTERHGAVWATPEAGAGVGSESSPSLEEDGDRPARLTYGNPEANTLRMRPRRNGVVLELTTHGFVAVAQDDGSVRLEVPGLEEFFGSSLPVKRTWVEALAGRDVKLVSVRARAVERFASLSPSASLEREVEASSRGSVRARMRRSGRRQIAREGAKLLEVGYQGEVKKALVELSPFTWDGSGLFVAKKLEVHVAFRGREARRARGSGGNAALRLVAKEPGLYRIALAELLGGRRAAAVGELRLSRQGESVAYHREAGMLYFWSEGAKANPYGGEAVYELELGVAGERMQVVDEALGSSAYYLESVEREENRYYQSALLEAPDLWLWEVLFAPAHKSFRFDVRELSAEAVSSSLSVWLQGTSDAAGVEDHHVRLHVNGSLVGESRWDGKQANVVQVELAAGVLREGENTLELESVLDTGAPSAVQMVDRFAVRYPRSTQRLESAAYVLDLTETPRWVSVREGFAPERDYEGFESARRPEVRAVARATLRSHHRRGADYLVIGPQAFLEAAEPLLRHRKRQGLRVVTASMESIASEFGHGELTPQSVRELIANAYHEWRAPKLRYVLLLGDGTFDYKDYLGTGRVNQVLPWIERTSFLWTASDPAYGAVHGEDLLPDVAVGRLPAQTVDELRSMVSKVLAYERGELMLSGPHVLVADDADEGGDFERDAESLATTLLAQRETTRLYLSELGPSGLKSGIVESFDTGAATMSYLGHGAIHLWADENVFNASRVARLSPQGQQPFLMTMNCLNGYFHFPFFDSLAEALLKAEDKGVIGAFSPSALSLNGPAHRYHRALLKELLQGGHARLGDAVLAAQEAYADTGAFPELLLIYHLFGDPALTLR